MNAPLRIPFASYAPDLAPFYADGINAATNCLPYLAAPNYSQSLAPSLSAVGIVTGGTYTANAVTCKSSDFEFTNNGTTLTGLVDGKTGSISFWIRPDSNSVPNRVFYLFNFSFGRFIVSWNASPHLNNFRIVGFNSSGTIILDISTSIGYSNSSKWYHFLASWNLGTSTSNIYVNNVSDKTVTTLTNDTINYTGATQLLIGDSGTTDAKTLSEIWFDTSFIDFSVAGNRAKFIDGNGFPVNLGSTGQTPTGSSPLLYMKDQASTFYNNSGTGGSFPSANQGTLSIASTSPSGSTPSQTVGAISLVDSNGVYHTYIGNTSALGEITATQSTNLSKSGGYAAAGYWKFVGFTATGVDNVYATDFNDPIQVMAVGGTQFANLAGSPPNAKCIGQINQFVVIGNTQGGTYNGGTAGTVPNRVWWPQIGNPANWPDPLTNTGIADQAGVWDAPLEYGAVLHITNGPFYGLVFQEHAITNMNYVGGSVVFQFNTFEKQRGLYCPNSVAQVGDWTYFIDSSGFFKTNGYFVEPIGHDLVDNTWLADVDTAYLDHVRVSHDQTNKCLWWTYKSLSASLLGGFVSCDKVIVYNYADNRWAMGYTGQSIDLIFSCRTLGYTMESLDSINSNLDLITPTLDSPYWNGGNPIVGMFGLQQIQQSGTYASYYGTFTGSALAATIDTKEMNLNEGGLAFVQQVNPVVMGAILGNITIAPITRNTLSASTTVGTANTPETRTGKVSMRSTARYHRFRVGISGGFSNAMGVEPEFTPAGQT